MVKMITTLATGEILNFPFSDKVNHSNDNTDDSVDNLIKHIELKLESEKVYKDLEQIEQHYTTATLAFYNAELAMYEHMQINGDVTAIAKSDVKTIVRNLKNIIRKIQKNELVPDFVEASEIDD